MTTTFVVEKNALARTGWARSEPTSWPDGAVRLAIDSFALTSDNITCAAFGEAMRGQGPAAIESTYAALLRGNTNPAEGHILSVGRHG